MMEAKGNQSDTLKRFLRRVIAVGVADSVPCNRIELHQGMRQIMPWKLGDASAPAVIDDIVAEMMQAAKDDCQETLKAGDQCTFTVHAYFGTDRDRPLTTRFSILKPMGAEDTASDLSGSIQSIQASGLRFMHGMSSELMKAISNQQNRLLATIDTMQGTIDSQAAQIKVYQDRAFKEEEEKQKRLNQEAERERLAAESERRDAITASLMEGAQVALGAFLPMLASGGKQLTGHPGVKNAIDWSIKKFANTITKEQANKFTEILSTAYNGEPYTDEASSIMLEGPRKFLFGAAMFATGRMPSPPSEEEGLRFFDYLIDNMDKTNQLLNACNIPQRLFVQAHIKARAETREAQAAE